jgi:uncharacterized protein with PIN domain
MDIVVDASVLIAIAANERDKTRLIRLTSGGDLIAHHLSIDQACRDTGVVV